MAEGGLSERFSASSPEALRPRLEAITDLEAVLEALLGAAHDAWPDILVPDDAFLAHLAERLPEGEDDDLRRTLLTTHSADLYLACACLAREDRALEEVAKNVLPAIVPSLRKVDAPEAVREEAIDRLQHVMLFGQDDRPPKIAKYAGRGTLKAWLAVSAVRDLLSELRRQREIPVDEDALVRAAAFEEDPALASLKEQYRAEFKDAFTAALGALSSRERVLLRHYYVDGLGSDVLAKLHRVHRVTVTRWLTRIRESLLEETRFVLAERLRVSGGELDSIMRLIQSQLHVSIQHMLVEGGDGDD